MTDEFDHQNDPVSTDYEFVREFSVQIEKKVGVAQMHD